MAFMYDDLLLSSRFLFSGDVRRTPDEMRQLISSFDGQAVRNDAITENVKLWPKATVPYSFSKKFKEEGKAAVKVAMQEISSKTCVQFIRVTMGPLWVV